MAKRKNYNSDNSTKRWMASVIFAVLNVAALVIFVWILKMGFEPFMGQAATGIYKALNFRGTLKGSGGQAITDGSYDFVFSIYDASATGTCLYTARGTCGTPTAKSIAVTGGVFSTLIGDTDNSDNPITIDFNSNTYWLGVKVGTDAELTPRVRIGASGYAFNADLLDGLDTSSNGGSNSFVPVTRTDGVLDLTQAVQTSSTFRDSYGWATHSRQVARLLYSQGGGFSASINPGGNFTTTTSWSSYDPGVAGLGLDVKGYSGGAFDGRYIYFAPHTTNGATLTNYHGKVLRYDTTGSFSATTSAWSAYDPGANGVGTKPKGYSGAVFDGRYVYFVPWHNNTDYHGEVLRYDTTGNFSTSTSWTTFDPSSNGASSTAVGFFSGIFDGRYVYFTPYLGPGGAVNNTFLRYDTRSNFKSISSWTTFSPGANGVGSTSVPYLSATFDGHYLYFAPYAGSGQFLRFNTSGKFDDASSWTMFDPSSSGLGSSAKDFVDATFDGRYIYFAQLATAPGQIVRYDTTSNFSAVTSWSKYDPGANGVGNDNDGFEGAIFDGRYIYFIPYLNGGSYHSRILRYDSVAAFDSAASWNVFDPSTEGIGTNHGYKGGVYDGRYIYFTPAFKNGSSNATHGEVLRYDTGAPDPQQGINQTARSKNFFLDSSGNIGVGTTTPSAQLHIKGLSNEIQLAITASSTQTANIFEIQTSAGVPEAWINPSGNFGTSGTIYSTGSGTSTFAYGATFATTGGNVGVGTSSPSQKLSVQGNALVSQHMSIGKDSRVNDGSLIYAGFSFSNLLSMQESVTDFSPAFVEGLTNYLELNPSGLVSNEIYGSDNEIFTKNGNANNFNLIVGVNNYIQHNGSGNVAQGSGSFNAFDNNSTGTITYAQGVQDFVGNEKNGNITSAYGNESYVYTGTNGTNGSITTAAGVRAYVNNLGAGTITNAYGILASSAFNSGTGTISNAYGLLVNAPINSGGGTVKNNYGLYIQDQSPVGSTNSYNIYSLGANSKNYFGGALSASSTLSVSGAVTSSNLYPWTNNTYDIGAFGNAWRDVYVSGTIYGSIATSTFYGSLATSTFYGSLATSTWYGNIATSTFPNITVTGLETLNRSSSTLDSAYQGLFVGTTATTSIYGTTTSTFGAGLQTTYLNITSNSATSTFANGINLSNGCFSMSGSCITASGLGGANTALSNLSAVAINTSLLPSSGNNNLIDLGAFGTAWRNIYASSSLNVGYGANSSTISSGNIMLSGSILPGAVNASDLGSLSLGFRNLFASSSLNVSNGANSSTISSGNIMLSGKLLPSANNSSDLGAYGTAFKDVYASGTIYGSMATSTFYGSITTSTLDNVTIGGSTPATGTFTGLIANQTASFKGIVNIGDGGDAVVVNSNTWGVSSAGVTSNLSVSTSTLDNVVIGGSTPAAAYFTRVSSTLASAYQGLFVGTTATTSIYGQTTSTFSYGLNVATTGGTLAINGTPVCLSNGANCAATSTAAGWTHSGTENYLTTGTDNVTVGASGSLAKLTVLGDSDKKQFVIKENSTQNANIFEIQNSSNTILSYISPAGNFGTSGTIYSSGSGTSTFANNLAPASNNLYDLGGYASAWRNAYVSGTLYGGTGSYTINGSSTSTFTSGIQASALNITSNSATSTFANGIQINGGCVLFGGTCLGGATGANTALSNLSAVAINTSLLPSSNNAIDLGAFGFAWRNEYVSSSIIIGSGGTASTTISSGNIMTSGNILPGSNYVSDLGAYGTAFRDVYVSGTIYGAKIAVSSSLGEATIIVAASSSVNKSKADYICTGTNDDVCIKTALAALPSTGGEVYLLEGTYSVSSTIVMATSSVKLVGSGKNTILQRSWNETAANNSGVITVGDNSKAYRGIVISNLAIDGNRNVYTNTNNYDIYVTNRISTSTISNTYIYNSKGKGIYFRGTNSNGAEGNLYNNITGNYIFDNTGDGLFFFDTNQGNVIANNTINDNGGYGIFFESSSLNGNVRNIITGNNLAANGSDNLYLHGYSGANLVSGNVSYSSSGTGLTVSQSDNNIISNNTVHTNNGYGIFAWGNQNEITGNHVYNNGSTGCSGLPCDGIFVKGGTAVNVSGNMIYSNKRHGIYASGDSFGNITDNEIYQNTQNGILLDDNATYVLVSGNDIYDNGGSGNYSGINVATSDYNTIASNKINDTAGTGFAISIASNRVGNYLSDNHYSGTGASSISDSGKGTVYSSQLVGAYLVLQTNNGNVGIGTITPSSTLTVASSTASIELGTGSVTSTFYAAATSTMPYGLNVATTAGTLAVNGQPVCLSNGTNCSGVAGNGANTALSNLSAVAINTSLLPSSNNAIDLGGYGFAWRSIYASSSMVLSSSAAASTSTNIFAISNANAASSTIMKVENSGDVSLGNDSFYFEASSTKSYVNSMETGGMFFEDDAGVVSWADMNVTNASVTGTLNGYSASINGTPIITVWSTSTGSGTGISGYGIAVNTSSPASTYNYKLLVDSGDPTNGLGVGVIGKINATGAITQNTSLDLAESYRTEPGCAASSTCPVPAEVVCASETEKEGVYQCNSPYDGKAIGVVSTKPGFVLNGLGSEDNTVLVALAGRVPVKVSMANGPIKIGDYLTSSYLPGVAMKATAEGSAIGKALEGYSGQGVGQILVLVGNSFVSPPAPQLTASTSTLAASTSTLADLTGLTVTGDPSGIGPIASSSTIFDVADRSIINVASISGAKWTIDENGDFATNGEIVKTIATSQGEKKFYPTYNGDPTIMLTGSGQLINGEARIVFDPALSEMVDGNIPMKVSVSLTSDGSQGIYVAAKSVGDILVKELHSGIDGATFDYIIVATRKMSGGVMSNLAYQATSTSNGGIPASAGMTGAGAGMTAVVSDPNFPNSLTPSATTSTTASAIAAASSTTIAATASTTQTAIANSTATSTTPTASTTSTPVASTQAITSPAASTTSTANTATSTISTSTSAFFTPVATDTTTTTTQNMSTSTPVATVSGTSG